MRQKDVVDCLSTEHISDSSLVCTAPEMTALNASIVIVATGLQSKLWAEASIIYADQLPGDFKIQNPEINSKLAGADFASLPGRQTHRDCFVLQASSTSALSRRRAGATTAAKRLVTNSLRCRSVHL